MTTSQTRFNPPPEQEYVKARALAAENLAPDTAKHAARVAELLRNRGLRAQTTAMLHDILEDSDLSPTALRSAGIGDDVLDALILLTRQEREPYGDYIDRLAPYVLPRLVKIADLQDNLRIDRMGALAMKEPERVRRLTGRYTAALALLMTREFAERPA